MSNVSGKKKSPKDFFFFMIYFIQHSKNMYIYSLDYTLFCGMKKHILKLAPFLNRCYWPGWITYSSIWLKRIETEFLPNSVLTKAEISHHSSSLCHTGSAVQFILISVFQLCLLMGYIKPFGFELALFPCKKISEQLKKKIILPWKEDCQGNIRGFNVCLSLISHINCVYFASAKMFTPNCHCF